MSGPEMAFSVAIDVPPLLAATLASVSCALLGSFLVLRRMSLMGDAISHAVLPGLVVAFMLTGSRATVPMLLGAAAAGLLTVVLVEVLKRVSRIEPGAAMGVVFSVLFALGVFMLERGAGRQADLDADCVLYGAMEMIFWIPPEDASVWAWSTLKLLPRQVWTLFVVTCVIVAAVCVGYKELRFVCFDPGGAAGMGIPVGPVGVGLMVLVAIATVASFEAVGSILVIAMLVCPAASARLLTDRMGTQLWVSAVLAALASVGGYFGAAFGPAMFGFEVSLRASGMIASVSGVILAICVLFAPSHGALAKLIRRARMRLTVAREDLLAGLYREEERLVSGGGGVVGGSSGGPAMGFLAGAWARTLGQVEVKRADAGRARVYRLTESGRTEARRIVRSHRLWESYLVERGGLQPDHVHDAAETLEHLWDARARERLLPRGLERLGERDPHDRPIPPGDGA